MVALMEGANTDMTLNAPMSPGKGFCCGGFTAKPEIRKNAKNTPKIHVDIFKIPSEILLSDHAPIQIQYPQKRIPSTKGREVS